MDEIKRIHSVSFDIHKLEKALQEALEICNFHPLNNQLSLTCSPDSKNPFYEGTGSLSYHLVKHKTEDKWKHIYIKDIIKNPKEYFEKLTKERWTVPDFLGDDATHDYSNLRLLGEKDFTQFIEEMSHTYFYEVYNKLSIDYKIGRVRLMRMKAKTCLTLHSDWQKRIHIPIITNEKCKLVVNNTVYHLPADGFAYVVDTTQEHTAFNASTHERIHLLFNLL